MPYRFRIDIFVSHADNVKNGAECCVTLERRGKTEATTVVTAKDKKAVFRQSITMECTLFRRAASNKGASSTRASSKIPPADEIAFDEKKAKMYLRKGSATGKSIGKIALNLSDYVKGTSSTVFADMKLSDGTVLVTKIEATMIHMGKKKKSGSKASDSDAGSEMTENNSVDDSIFDDDDDLDAITREEPPEPEVPDIPQSHAKHVTEQSNDMHLSRRLQTSPVMSDASKGSEEKPPRKNSAPSLGPRLIPPPVEVPPPTPSGDGDDVERRNSFAKKLFMKTPLSSKSKTEADGKESPGEKSEKSKEKKKDRSKKDKDKEREKDKDKDKENEKERKSGRVTTDLSKTASRKHSIVESHDEVKELLLCLESLKKENGKLKKANHAATEEVEILRNDLMTLEETIEKSDNNQDKGAHLKVIELQKLVKEKDKELSELSSHNKNLLDELEEQHGELKEASKRDDEVEQLLKEIEDLELKLQREPEFVEVVNELKVAKVSLALANMEKEQAIFALQLERQANTPSSREPSSLGVNM